MTTVKLKSVSMGPLSDLLEQWWATVTISGDGVARTLVRISVSWSPCTNTFTPEHDGTSILEVGDDGRDVSVDEAVAAFLASPERDRAYAAFRAHALKHRADLPERVAVMEASR